MKRFNKITIIGVGLIGGSIGLAIRKKGLAKEVIGVFRHRSTLQKALKHKAVDRAVMSLKDGVRDSDIIILASPVSSIPFLAREAVRYAKKGAIITDVGSTKRWLVDKVEKIKGSFFFVGAHPMAGSEHTGVEYSRYDLLQGTPCIVTKTAGTNHKALKIIVNFWKALGAKVKVMTPSQHDRSVSLISHLPHIAAFAIAGAVPEDELIYAAEGFKDTTRVASSDPRLWADIFLTNRIEVMNAVRIFEKYCKDIVKALLHKDYPKVVRLLENAKSKRDKLIYKKCAKN